MCMNTFSSIHIEMNPNNTGKMNGINNKKGSPMHILIVFSLFLQNAVKKFKMSCQVSKIDFQYYLISESTNHTSFLNFIYKKNC